MGGGSAGCVVANRLSANPANKVLLIEQGPNKDSDLIRAPGLCATSNSSGLYTTWFQTVPQKHCNNRKLMQPRGRMLGGSSTTNLMLYVRGHREDYDRWATKTGDDKFKYENVLPFFKKSQAADGFGDDEFNGREGLLKVMKQNTKQYKSHGFHEAYINAGSRRLGKDVLDDFNGADQEGFGYGLELFGCSIQFNKSYIDFV